MSNDLPYIAASVIKNGSGATVRYVVPVRYLPCWYGTYRMPRMPSLDSFIRSGKTKFGFFFVLPLLPEEQPPSCCAGATATATATMRWLTAGMPTDLRSLHEPPAQSSRSPVRPAATARLGAGGAGSARRSRIRRRACPPTCRACASRRPGAGARCDSGSDEVVHRLRRTATGLRVARHGLHEAHHARNARDRDVRARALPVL